MFLIRLNNHMTKGHRIKDIILQPFLQWVLQKCPTVPDQRPPLIRLRQHIPCGTSPKPTTPSLLTLRMRLLLTLGPRVLLIACLLEVGVTNPLVTDPSYVGHTIPTLLHIDRNG